MAKGNMFVGTAKGKVGNLVLSKFHGEQITKAYQPTVANPKTFAQMYQRARFANAVKFYQRATTNFFKFAFEDKKNTESDFNAFMRHNVKNSLVVNRSNYLEPGYPALGNNWRLSDGSLTIPIDVSFPEDGGVQINLGSEVGGDGTTIGDVSTALVKSGAQVGDIFTFILIRQSVLTTYDVATLEGTTQVQGAPVWSILQFFIDPEDSTSLMEVATQGAVTAADGFALVGGELAPADSVVLSGSSLVPAYDETPGFANMLAWAAAIVSRRQSGGSLKVTRADLVPNSYAYYVQNLLAADGNMTSNVESWQNGVSSVPSAVILKGGIAAGLATTSNVSGSSEQAGGEVTSISGNGDSLPVESSNLVVPGSQVNLVVNGVNLSKDNFSLEGDGVSNLQVSVNDLATQATVIFTVKQPQSAYTLRYNGYSIYQRFETTVDTFGGEETLPVALTASKSETISKDIQFNQDVFGIGVKNFSTNGGGKVLSVTNYGGGSASVTFKVRASEGTTTLRFGSSGAWKDLATITVK